MQHGVEVYGPSWADDVDGINVPNLRKLSAYLKTLPEDYDHFHMFVYYKKGDMYEFGLIRVEHECGTAACAIGHGISAGIPANGADGWSSYVNNFIDEDKMLRTGYSFHGAFEWMFGSDWYKTDNTPHGAAARIDWFLNNGTPSDWQEQQLGYNELCY